MPKADGTVLLDTKINSDGIEAGTQEIKSAFKRVSETGKNLSSSVNEYSKEALKFIDDYVKNIGKASASNNEFKETVEKAKKELSELEENGLYFGDEEYDDAFLKLQKVLQAVKDYKKELLSPTPDANPFGLDTLPGKIIEAERKLSHLADAGKGLGNAEYDEAFRKLQLMKAEAKEYAAELSKTPAQIQKESAAREAARVKREAARAKEEARINSLNQKLEETRAKEVQAIMEAKRLKSIGDNANISRQDIVDLNNELIKLTARQKELSSAGVGLGFEEFDQNTARIAQINAQLRQYQDSLNESNIAQKKLNSSMKKGSKSARGFRMSIGQVLKTTLLYGTVSRVIFSITAGIKAGFENLAQYSGTTNKSISMLMSSLTRLKNSFATAFAPILNVVAPILSRFIDMVSVAATAVGQLMAALTGKSTFTRAVAVQEDYAASLEDSAAAAKDAEKAMKKYLSPLDEINKISTEDVSSGGYTGVSPSQMFEEVPVESKFQKFADNLKNIFSNIFAPFKEAWALDGQSTVNAAKAALTNLSDLSRSVGNSLMKVWTNGTGTKILSTMLQIAQRTMDTIGNIASRLNEAWNTNQVGTQIVQAIADIFQKILDFVNRIATDTANWAAKIDFYPLLESIKNLLESLSPVIEGIGNFLAGIYESVILPLGTALIETILPAIINALSGLFNFLGENQWIIEAVGAALLGAFAASKIVPLITTIIGAVKGIITVLGSSGLGGAISSVVSAMGGPLTLAITAAVAIIVLLITHWDEVMAVMQKFDDWLQDIFSKDWTETFGIFGDVLNGFFAGVESIWNGIKEIFSGIITFVKGVFSGNWKQAWEGIKQIFKGIWDTLVGFVKTPVNTIIGIINGLISGVVSGINTVISALNNLHFDIPDWVPALGGKSFGFNLSPITAPKIPYLASGAVIPPNSPFVAVLGDQRNGNNLELPESLLRRIIREENGKSGGGSYRFSAQINRRVLFDEFITEAKLRQSATGQNPFELA